MPTPIGGLMPGNHPYNNKIHKPYSDDWSYADATARLADTGFVTEDVGRLALQQSDNTLWMLTDHSPITWVQVSGSGSAGITIRKNSGANVGTRSRLNFIEGPNITLTVTDDGGGGEVDITIEAADAPGYPFDVITVDATDPDADYATIAAAAAVAVTGDVILIGPGEYDCDEVDLEAGVRLVGLGAVNDYGLDGGATVLKNSLQTSEYCLGLMGDSGDKVTQLLNLRVKLKVNNSGGHVGALKALDTGAWVSLQDCWVFSQNQQAGGLDAYCFIDDWFQVDINGGFYEAFSSSGNQGLCRDSAYVWPIGLPSLPDEAGPTAGGVSNLVEYTGSDGVQFFGDSFSDRIQEFSTDGTLTGNSDNALPTEQAVKTYVDAQARMDIVEMVPALRLWVPGGRLTAAGLIGDNANGLDLTRNGGLVVGRGNKHSYLLFDGTNDYVSRANEALINISATEAELESAARGFTIMGWVYHNAGPGGGAEIMAAKYDHQGGGTPLFSWYLQRRSVAGWLEFLMRNPAGGATVSHSGSVAIPATTWTFVAVRFVPSTEIVLWTGATKEVRTLSIPASMDTVTAPLTFGVLYDSLAAMGGWLGGRESNLVIAAANLPDDMVDTYRLQTAPLYS